MRSGQARSKRDPSPPVQTWPMARKHGKWSLPARRTPEKVICQLACKPGSVWLRRAGTWQPFIWDDACASPHATHPDDRPGNGLERFRGPRHPYSVCSRWGLPCRRCYQRRGGLLPHPFTLTRSEDRAVLLSVALSLRLPPAGRYPAPCFSGARTFLTPPPFGIGEARLPANWRGSINRDRRQLPPKYAFPTN